jgi:hypothetical protein
MTIYKHDTGLDNFIYTLQIMVTMIGKRNILYKGL